MTAFPKIIRQEGVIRGFYSGFGPILFKQIPYTMAKFAVQGFAAEAILSSMGKTPDELSDGGKMGLALTSGVIAGNIPGTVLFHIHINVLWVIFNAWLFL